MTLLAKLQNALSKVNGNTKNLYDDRGYDEYYCTIGDHRVYEQEYIPSKNACWCCVHKEDLNDF